MATRVIPSLRGPSEVVKPSLKHTATVILLHGLGDSGNGWLGIVKPFKDEFPHVKDEYKDRDGMLDSARMVDKYIQDEINAGIPAQRIVVGGFSQGGAMSLLAGLTARREDGLFGEKYGWKLGGVVVLSGWLALHDSFPKVAFAPREHSFSLRHQYAYAMDTVVPYSLSQKASGLLTNELGLAALENLTLLMLVPLSGYSLDESKLGTPGLCFRSYRSAGHEACERTLEDLKQFLERVFLQ